MIGGWRYLIIPASDPLPYVDAFDLSTLRGRCVLVPLPIPTLLSMLARPCPRSPPPVPHSLTLFPCAAMHPSCPFPPFPYPLSFPSQTFQYHSRGWLANLNARPDCQVVPLNDVHWLMVGPVAAEYEAAVLGWLATTIGSQGASAAPAASVGTSPIPAAPVSVTGASGGEGKKER